MTADIVGIVNVTEDSFSDGGRYLSPEKALAQAKTLSQQGAKIIDIGASSSHPDASHISAAQEIERLQTVIPPLIEAGYELSVDSFYTQTQKWALAQGVQWLNDIHGFSDPDFYDELAAYDCKLIVMYAVQSRGIAQRMDVAASDIMTRIFEFFDMRLAALEKAGIAKARIIIDPGMGFFLGTDPQNSIIVMQNLVQLKTQFELPLLVSVSRKSFLREISGATLAEADSPTLAAELWLEEQGVDYIRTHNVQKLVQARKIFMQLDT